MSLDLEELYVSRQGWGCETATPVGRAILRASQSKPLAELASDADVLEAFGGSEAIAALPTEAPLEVDIQAGIRTGKSRIASCVAFFASQTVDVSRLAPGEIPRVSVVSLRIDSAQVVLDHLVGTLESRPWLKKLLLEEPTSDSILLRHPSGRPIEVKVVAGARAGGTLVARWSAGAVFDEYARMVGADDAVVNYDDARRAVLGRLLPGAQVWSIGSRWAPMGPAYERAQSHFGKPTREHLLVAATGPQLNPVHWTPEKCAALQKSDDLAYRTDVLNEFADPESAFFTQTEIKRATRVGPLVMPSEPNTFLAAGIDPGTRGNSWPLVLVQMGKDMEGVYRFSVLLACQWTGTSSMPLSPVEIFAAIERKLRPYGQVPVISDQHSADALLDIATRTHVKLRIKSITSANRNELFERIKGQLSQGTLELPNEPVLLRDLASVRRRVTQAGLAYHLPKTPDGRHADYVPALALALSAFGGAAALQAAEAYARKTAALDIELGRTWMGSDYQRQQAHLADMPEQMRTRAMRILHQANFRPEEN